jgi:hypothetical protein
MHIHPLANGNVAVDWRSRHSGQRDPEIILHLKRSGSVPAPATDVLTFRLDQVFKAWPDVAISIKEALIES